MIHRCVAASACLVLAGCGHHSDGFDPEDSAAEEAGLADTVQDLEGDDIDATEGGDQVMTPEIDTFREEEGVR